MGFIPAPPPSEPFRPNLDRHGMPKDYATYIWLLYKRVVKDESPERLAFLHGTDDHPRDFGQQLMMR
jgi:hypothetical protein